MNCSMPVFLGISGINPLFIWWHNLRLILAGKIKLSLGVISMRWYNNIISWITQAWLRNIKEGISGCHRTAVPCGDVKKKIISCRFQSIREGQRGAKATSHPLWSVFGCGGWNAGLRDLELLFPGSLQVSVAQGLISDLPADAHPEGGGSDSFSGTLCF